MLIIFVAILGEANIQGRKLPWEKRRKIQWRIHDVARGTGAAPEGYYGCCRGAGGFRRTVRTWGKIAAGGWVIWGWSSSIIFLDTLSIHTACGPSLADPSTQTCLDYCGPAECLAPSKRYCVGS
jgi:hypothetical protein